MMQYVSTRGSDEGLTYTDIVLRGLAPDGGLYLPKTIPLVSREELRAFRNLSYADLAAEVIGRFADDIPREDLRAICRRTYTPQVYCNTREGDDPQAITPLTPLGDGLYLLGLSNGPTLAFKDMAMQFLGNLFEYVLARRGAELNILGATSGDTGSSAEYAMRGRRGVRVFMLSPAGRMSAFQRAQMYTLDDANIHNIAIKGTFDECQDIIKAIGGDNDFKRRHAIGAVNSINWARVAAQIVYYFRGWLLATESDGEEVAFCVPSGNFGDVLAGWIAKKMGLPVASLIVATNENDVLDEFFRTGVYRPRDAAHTYKTSSPSMDISRASNFERFVWDAVGGSGEKVASLWKELREKGSFALTGPAWDYVQKSGFLSGSSTHADRLATIAEVYWRSGLLIDPHTADGVKVAIEKRTRGIKTLCLETAQAVKFAETIRDAVSLDPAVPASCEGLSERPQHVTVMENDAAAVRAYIEKALA